MIPLIATAEGRWVTTAEAIGWPRCARCRRPHERGPFGEPVCTTCFFYGPILDAGEFWRIHEAAYPLAPYNIGSRSMKLAARFDRRPLCDPTVNWRRYLREGQQHVRPMAAMLAAWHTAHPEFEVKLRDGRHLSRADADVVTDQGEK